MNFLILKIMGILVGGFLFLGTSSGQAFVSPEHYEKLKMQKIQKTREPEKAQPREPDQIQGHRSNQGKPPAGKTGAK